MTTLRLSERDALPQLSEQVFLTDGGIETSLIYRQGCELPELAGVRAPGQRLRAEGPARLLPALRRGARAQSNSSLSQLSLRLRRG